MRIPNGAHAVKHKDIPAKDRLIFAMDVPTCDRAKELAEELGDAVTFYKIGLELMMSGEYFDLLDWMLARDKKVFCDLKFFDIPATVGSAVRSLKDRGATFVTVHGNRSIMEAAAENKGDTLKVLGVTVLT
jgi:orotidine-5'-phosphate decarboxylase